MAGWYLFRLGWILLGPWAKISIGPLLRFFAELRCMFRHLQEQLLVHVVPQLNKLLPSHLLKDPLRQTHICRSKFLFFPLRKYLVWTPWMGGIIWWLSFFFLTEFGLILFHRACPQVDGSEDVINSINRPSGFISMMALLHFYPSLLGIFWCLQILLLVVSSLKCFIVSLSSLAVLKCIKDSVYT